MIQDNTNTNAVSTPTLSIDRQKATLSQNPIFCKDHALIDQILSDGNYMTFEKGEALIEQGDNADLVFFLLSGEVAILVNGEKRERRAAPKTVGEMAARRSGALRTTTVKVESKEVIALSLDGDKFRNLLNAYPDFHEQVGLDIEQRLRDRLSDPVRLKGESYIVWTIAAAIAAILFTGFAWHFLPGLGIDGAGQYFLSAIMGLAVFLIVSLFNPQYFWKRMIAAAVLHAGFSTYGFTASASGGELETPLSASFDASNSGNSVGLALNLLFWLIVILTCAYKDRS